VGLLAGLRLTKYVARRYAGRIRRGDVLLSVHCDSWRPEYLLRFGAAAEYGTTDKPTERPPAAVTHRGEAPVRQTTEYIAHEIKK